MPYHVGEKGSYGCSGYPTVKDDGTVMGCHKTQAQAEAQVTAINISEHSKSLAVLSDEELDRIDKQAPCWTGFVQRGMKEKDGRMVPNCVPATKMFDADTVSKAELAEGDFVITGKEDEIYVGQIVHIMREGTLGIPGTEDALEASQEAPAALIKLFEQDDDGWWEPTDYFYGCMLAMLIKIDPLPMEPTLAEMDKEAYSPPAGARSAARKAIKFKEDGKATGAGTMVGWTRARQLANGESLSLSTVKRMYSYFSRHEVDKKGRDWGSQSNPSKGYVMWLAWGGDAGYSWSRSIVERAKDKALFAEFGKDYTNVQQMTNIFKD